MKNIIIIILLLIPGIAITQDSTLTEKEGASIHEADEIRFLKNEFGLALNPVLINFLGGSEFETRWALAYRRHLNDKFSLRFIAGFNFDPESDGDRHGGTWNSIYNLDSSMRFDQHSYSEKYLGFQLNAGMQYNWGKKKLKWFTGMDLIFNQTRYINHTDSITSEYETDLGSYIQQNSTNIWKTISGSDQFGVFPFIGIRTMFNKHWGFTTHFGYNLSIGMEYHSVSHYGIAVPDSGERWTSFNVNASGLFQDVSIVFRF